MNICFQFKLTISIFSHNLWKDLEEVAPDSWDDFADLFSRQVVAAKPVKPKTENKPVKQQTVKSECTLFVDIF